MGKNRSRRWLSSVSITAALFTTMACSQPATPGNDGPPAAVTNEAELPTSPSKPAVTIAFGGDVMFEGNLRRLLETPTTALKPIAPELSKADFTMVNLEAAVTTRGTPAAKELEDENNRYYFRAGPAALTALESAGVDAVTVANNHGADFGSVGLRDTLQARRNHGLPMVGVGVNREDAFTAHEAVIKGSRFSFFGADASFLESNSPIWQAGPQSAGLASARGAGREALVRAVEKAATTSAPIVYLHWGEEGASCPTGAQTSLARELAAAGATAIVGSHAHRVQGAGWAFDSYVSYGLGNFVWYHGNEPTTGLLELTVKDGEVIGDRWAPARIPENGGLPAFSKGASAAQDVRSWEQLRNCAKLEESPPEASPVAEEQPPQFKSSVSAITPRLATRMKTSYRAGCPVPLAKLRYLNVSFVDFSGKSQTGEIVVAANQASRVVGVFRKLYEQRYRIRRMELVSNYGSNDDRSMRANNTSGFNCRAVANTTRFSQHSYGTAIDINPLQNPYVINGEVLPPEGRRWAFVERSEKASADRGVIKNNDAAVRAFRTAGWSWGGLWSPSKDYQHFSASGR